MRDALKEAAFCVGGILIGGMACLVGMRSGGLIAAGAILIPETAIVLTGRIFGAKHIDWVLPVCASAGLVAGACLYPVKSFPEELGIAACLMTVLFHLGFLLVALGLSKQKGE